MRNLTKNLTVLIVFIISILMIFPSCEKCGDDENIMVFKDVNVITMCNDSILKEHSVLVKDGKIADIGIFKEMNIPKKAQIINGKEKYLIPGLGDMHVHVTDDDERLLYVANGVTLIRNMSGAPYHLKVREKINKKCLIGPEIYTTGPLIDGLNPIWPGSFIISDKDKVFEELSQMKKDGYDAIKVYEKLSKEVYDEIIRVAKELEMPVVGHVPRSVDLEYVINSGQFSIEHLANWKYYYDKQIISETVKRGVWNCPTLLIYKNFKNLNYLKKNPPSEIKYLNPSIVEFTNNQHQINVGFAKQMQLLNTLTNNNANIVVGTDAPNLFIIAGFSLHEELSIWQDAGLTPYQILLSATRNCAEMLGYESRLGTIEKEKDADLVLLKNNPLEDIKNTKSIEGVMTKGSWYPKAELNSILDELAAKKNSLMQKSTIHNNQFIKILMIVLALTFLSTFVIRPSLYLFNRSKLKSLISNDTNIIKYGIRFLVISLSIISLIILYLIVTLPEAIVQSGLPTLLTSDLLTRCKILLPLVNLIFFVVLFILYTIVLLRNDLSKYSKWHTLSIIFASTIFLVLLNYWELLNYWRLLNVYM